MNNPSTGCANCYYYCNAQCTYGGKCFNSQTWSDDLKKFIPTTDKSNIKHIWPTWHFIKEDGLPQKEGWYQCCIEVITNDNVFIKQYKPLVFDGVGFVDLTQPPLFRCLINHQVIAYTDLPTMEE